MTFVWLSSQEDSHIFGHAKVNPLLCRGKIIAYSEG